ncbi:MAG: UTP--glucose-1-phosphate uridylyltransferase [Simkaniaceae bacterium]|nr:UTP--glucose-1-phosphate uridylyltransferase [Simkaniaceae bacterium]
MNLRILQKPLYRQKEHLRSLLVRLRRVSSIRDKIEILNALPEVDAFFSFPSPLKTFLKGLSLSCEYVIKEIFAIGQGKRLFGEMKNDVMHRLRPLVEDLLALETFYQDLGGIIGYQHLVLTLLTVDSRLSEKEQLALPEGEDLNKDSLEVRKAIIEGIKRQGMMGELYPVGGAADRLQLEDEKTQEKLPAASLIFLGKPLLESVIADLQAREYLHYKLFGAQVTTPIGMMTSRINRNHEHIRSICMQNKWFARPKSAFKFFNQPLVPTFTKKGEWCLQKPLKLLLKPGGHGMLWKLLKQNRVFEWFDSLGATKALIRQINNPMAAVDHGLLAFLGLGHKRDKAFGFASCPRLVSAHEGMNALKEIQGKKVLTNIEYCDFEKYGIEDEPNQPDGKYSRFPSNTNILFADLKAVHQAVEKFPHPGLLINFRKGYHYHAQEEKEEIARLETTMQNIADAFAVEKKAPLPSYLTFNERRKTISTTKKKSSSTGKMLETPEGCYYDFMLNAQELLKNHCQMELPTLPDKKTFAKKGPSFLFSYHPALGPLYSIIGQKIRRGKLYRGSELQLEIADLELENLALNGSLLILATDPMGLIEKETLVYSNQTGCCHLKNVQVKNGGIDWDEDHLFWKHEIKRVAALKIVLHGHSEFFAEDLKIEGDLTLEVPHGMRMRAQEKKGQVIFTTELLDRKEPFWTYSIDPTYTIDLNRNTYFTSSSPRSLF